MSSAVARFGTKVPTICACCQRLAAGFAYSTNKWGKGPHIWWCETCAMQLNKSQAEKIYKMTTAKMQLWENPALKKAGKDAGEFLDTIGKTDLATLTEDEWLEFLRRFVVARERHLRNAIVNNEAPF